MQHVITVGDLVAFGAGVFVVFAAVCIYAVWHVNKTGR